MSGTRSIPSIPTRSPAKERNYRKTKTSFQDGILQEYGSVKFSEVKDDNPLLYAHSRRPKAILQAKALRQLDKALGIVTQAYADKSTLSAKERRKRANRKTYENGVIGNRAVQECIRDLFIGYDIRHVSQELRRSRLQRENLELEKQLAELKCEKRCRDSFRNEKIGPGMRHLDQVDNSNQVFRQNQLMMPEDFGQEVKQGLSYPMQSGNYVYQRSSSQPRQYFTVRADQTQENSVPPMQTDAPYQYESIFLPQNHLTQKQTMHSLNMQRSVIPWEFQPYDPQLSQHQLLHLQGVSSMHEQQASIPRAQSHHQPLDQDASFQGNTFPINQSPQHVFRQGQSPLVQEENRGIQRHNEGNELVSLERQVMPYQTPYQGLYHPTHFEVDQHMSIDQDMNEDEVGMMLAANPVLQNEQSQDFRIPVVPIAYSNPMSSNIDLAR